MGPCSPMMRSATIANTRTHTETRLERSMILISVLDWTEWRFRTWASEEDPLPHWRGITYLVTPDRITVLFGCTQRNPVFCQYFVLFHFDENTRPHPARAFTPATVRLVKMAVHPWPTSSPSALFVTTRSGSIPALL